jgi:hypothetical protein
VRRPRRFARCHLHFQPPTGKQGQAQLRADIPEAAGRGGEIAFVDGIPATTAHQHQPRVLLGHCHADIGCGRRQFALGLTDIRPPPQQVGRQAHRCLRERGRNRPFRCQRGQQLGLGLVQQYAEGGHGGTLCGLQGGSAACRLATLALAWFSSLSEISPPDVAA